MGVSMQHGHGARLAGRALSRHHGCCTASALSALHSLFHSQAAHTDDVECRSDTHRQLLGQVGLEPGVLLDLGDGEPLAGVLLEYAADQVAALPRQALGELVLDLQDRLQHSATCDAGRRPQPAACAGGITPSVLDDMHGQLLENGLLWLSW